MAQEQALPGDPNAAERFRLLHAAIDARRAKKALEGTTGAERELLALRFGGAEAKAFEALDTFIGMED